MESKNSSIKKLSQNDIIKIMKGEDNLEDKIKKILGSEIENLHFVIFPNEESGRKTSKGYQIILCKKGTGILKGLNIQYNLKELSQFIIVNPNDRWNIINTSSIVPLEIYLDYNPNNDKNPLN